MVVKTEAEQNAERRAAAVARGAKGYYTTKGLFVRIVLSTREQNLRNAILRGELTAAKAAELGFSPGQIESAVSGSPEAREAEVRARAALVTTTPTPQQKKVLLGMGIREIPQRPPGVLSAIPATGEIVFRTEEEKAAAEEAVNRRLASSQAAQTAAAIGLTGAAALAAGTLAKTATVGGTKMGVFGLGLTAARSVVGSSIGRKVLGAAAVGGAFAGGQALISRVFRGGDGARRVRRGTNILTKRGMKQIRRIGKFKRQVQKAASELGYTLRRRGGGMSMRGSRGVITAEEAFRALKR